MKIIAITAHPSRITPMDVFPGAPTEWIFLAGVEELDEIGEADLYIDLDFKPEESRVERLSRLLPVPVLINSVVSTLAEIKKPFIRINAWPGFLERTVHEVVVPDPTAGKRMEDLYDRLGKGMKPAPDIPGMISARVLSMIINEAYFTLQAGVSTREEIDTAMRLGTNYPYGPFEWGKRIGLERIHQLLRVLGREDSRYAPADAMAEEVLAMRGEG